MPVYNDEVANTVRAVLALRRAPTEWAEISPVLLRLREAVRSKEENQVGATHRALRHYVPTRRVDGFGHELDLENDEGVSPGPGLREVANSLLAELGFPEPPADAEPAAGDGPVRKL
ncbi:hypothetical protein EV384_4612 [Micromonospora kangleipakensis]|uniref:Uncharacterized protein n=1 Tax=Micromonospora kangleipakensis TaxID=1077942 RepID=A0A4V2GDI6_9ACTN|nr:hypothetical protein [Micromonospora kangleipakensis]RZU76016.1 hypothetical protein EV384_4612 [Micromonospora kangleipakensis]